MCPANCRSALPKIRQEFGWRKRCSRLPTRKAGRAAENGARLQASNVRGSLARVAAQWRAGPRRLERDRAVAHPLLVIADAAAGIAHFCDEAHLRARLRRPWFREHVAHFVYLAILHSFVDVLAKRFAGGVFQGPYILAPN
jgi:hypothetical protein